FADRLVPEPSGMAQNGQGIWVRTLYGQQENQGDGATNAAWNGHVKGIQIGADLWPADEDSSHKLGVYVGFLDSNANVSGKTIYTSNA
ncbi:autotransporter outer membrane beta-barrel domain-containing protein, partial [Salmonella sp. hn-h2]|nr:autotransporter outer membrane beta-barrel domain-containing protein [Salmonella sp. hn-h2]